jgi:hypothetical protein
VIAVFAFYKKIRGQGVNKIPALEITFLGSVKGYSLPDETKLKTAIP